MSLNLQFLQKSREHPKAFPSGMVVRATERWCFLSCPVSLRVVLYALLLLLQLLLSRFSLVRLCATAWTAANQAPLSTGFSRQEYWSGLLFPSPHICSVCPTLCDPMDCSPPSSSVHGIFQASILEWVALSSSRGSSLPRNQTWVSCIECRQTLYHWATWEAPILSPYRFLIPHKAASLWGHENKYFPKRGNILKFKRPWNQKLSWKGDKRDSKPWSSFQFYVQPALAQYLSWMNSV